MRIDEPRCSVIVFRSLHFLAHTVDSHKQRFSVRGRQAPDVSYPEAVGVGHFPRVDDEVLVVQKVVEAREVPVRVCGEADAGDDVAQVLGSQVHLCVYI
jgi:hypothetical protein